MAINSNAAGLSVNLALQKRMFDFVLAFVGLLLLWWVILITAFLARRDTGESGFFLQTRVGRNGDFFKVIKIRTMKSSKNIETTVTASDDVRITKLGAFLREKKLDELPQLINILIGQMSFVGPRPDVPGFADRLLGEQKLILSVRPGITGPATLAYRHEEELLSTVDDPEKYNNEVIFPDKVRLNLEYINNYSLASDVKYIIETVLGK